MYEIPTISVLQDIMRTWPAMKDFLEWHAPTPRRSWYRPSEERLCWAPTRSQFLCLQIRIRFFLTVPTTVVTRGKLEMYNKMGKPSSGWLGT